MHESSARTATPAAASATIPAVLVRLCTRWKDKQRRLLGTSRAPRYWNVTGNVWVLLELFFSPGTGSTVAVTLEEPALGEEMSGT